jgi:hypothetical protein
MINILINKTKVHTSHACKILHVNNMEASSLWNLNRKYSSGAVIRSSEQSAGIPVTEQKKY